MAENSSRHSQRKCQEFVTRRCEDDTNKANCSRELASNISLHQACEEGNLCMVQHILTQKTEDMDSRGKFGRSPVMVAVRMRHVSIFDFLVSRGCDMTSVDNYNDSVLHHACVGGSIDIVQKLLVNTTIDIESRGDHWFTPVLSAACHGHRGVVDLLLKSGCNRTVVDTRRRNILHFACLGNHSDLVRYILLHDIVDIDSKEEKGSTPVMLAAKKGSVEVVDLLVQKGCDLTIVNANKSNILHITCANGHVDLTRYILNNELIGIESKGYLERTPVMLATRYGNKDVFDLLETEGCSLTAVDAENNNILHFACVGGHVGLVKKILTMDLIDIEGRGYRWRTPVMLAAEHGHREVFDLLEKQYCNLTVLDAKGYTLLHMACMSSNVNLVRYILDSHLFKLESTSSNGWSPLHIAVVYGNIKVVEVLLKRGSNIKTVDKHGNTVLHTASLYGYVSKVKYILKKNMVDIDSRDRFGRTPVMLAADVGSLKTVDVLVKAGCNVTLTDNDGNNVLHLACFRGYLNVVKLILKTLVVDIDCRGFTGRTPIMIAAYYGNEAIVGFLVKKGSNLSSVDDNKCNIFHRACFGGNLDMVKYTLKLLPFMKETRCSSGMTPLLAAVSKGHIQVFDLLVRSGCNLTAVTASGNNILHIACICGQVNMVKYILRQKLVDIESQGYMGRTSLLLAAEKGYRVIVDLLLRKGSQTMASDEMGNNVFHAACSGGNVGMVKYLLNIERVRRIARLRNVHGYTPAKLAQQKGHVKVLALLRARHLGIP